MFLNRKNELNYLNRVNDKGGARFLVVYGRRRIGKTELLRHFSKDKKHLFFSSDLSSEAEQLRQFTEKIHQVAGESFLEKQTFTSWEALFRYLFDHLTPEIPLIIIDEFPYLCVGNRALPSILQKVWDEKGKDTGVFLILCGSYMSFMEKEVLASKSPLFGRRTGQMLLEPLRFNDLKLFYPNYSKQERVYAHAVLGGTPAYLRRFSDRQSFERNILNEVLDKNAMLYAEPRFLLMEELREPALYFLILKAISFGRNRLNEIVQETGISDRAKVNKYLSVLRELGLIRREVPVTEESPHKSRKGIYTIRDFFFRFWFRYVYPNYSWLEEGDTEYVWKEKIRPNLDGFTGPVFESVCTEKLKDLNRENKLPFKASKIGRWWHGPNEIDILVFDGKGSYLFCECKWSGKMVGKNILYDLMKKAESFPDARRKYFGLFSRSGFREEINEMASSGDDLFLFDY